MATKEIAFSFNYGCAAPEASSEEGWGNNLADIRDSTGHTATGAGNSTIHTGYLVAKINKINLSSACKITDIKVQGIISGDGSGSSIMNPIDFYYQVGYDLNTTFPASEGYGTNLSNNYAYNSNNNNSIVQTNGIFKEICAISKVPSWSQNFNTATQTSPQKYNLVTEKTAIQNLIHNSSNSETYSIWFYTRCQGHMSAVRQARYTLKNLTGSIIYDARSNIKFKYGPNSNYTLSQNNVESGLAITVPSTISDAEYDGYELKNWTWNYENGDSGDGTVLPQTTDYDITCTANYEKVYCIIFNQNTANGPASWTFVDPGYVKQELIDSINYPTSPTSITHEFLGWSINSNASSASWSSGQKSILSLKDYAENDPTENGFPIVLYAIWKKRDSITFKEIFNDPISQNNSISQMSINNNNNQALSGSYDTSLSLSVNPNAVSNNTCYFNQGQSYTFTYSGNGNNFEGLLISDVNQNQTTITTGYNNEKTSFSFTIAANGTDREINFILKPLPFKYNTNQNTEFTPLWLYWNNSKIISIYYENTKLL